VPEITQSLRKSTWAGTKWTHANDWLHILNVALSIGYKLNVVPMFWMEAPPMPVLPQSDLVTPAARTHGPQEDCSGTAKFMRRMKFWIKLKVPAFYPSIMCCL